MPLLAAAVAAFAGCAAPDRTGLTLDAVNKRVGGPKAGRARIVVLRDKGFAGIVDGGWQVHVDGTPMGEVKTGTFVYRDLPAGRRQLVFAPPGQLARASRHEFAAAAGRTYFFRLQINEKGRMVSGSAGLAGYFIASAIADASDDRGLFDFIPLEAAAAQEAMADLRLVE
jgi:hypothetical protein